MEYSLVNKIMSDEKLHQFLINNSQWYKYLNRNSDNFKQFYSAFKEDERNKRANKFNSALDTLDTVNTIFKIMK